MIEDDEHADSGLALGRTLALSDGIFAIAMTLLAFQIQPPDLTGDRIHHLGGVLGNMSGRYYVYALSFAVIGLFWLAHHRVFRYIERADDSLMYLNLVVLMAVAALPFPSGVLGRYGNQRVAVVLYAAAMAVTGSLLTALWVVAQRHQLLSPRISEARIREGLWRGGSTAVVFAASIPIALVAPALAPYTWLAILVARLWPWARRRWRTRLAA